MPRHSWRNDRYLRDLEGRMPCYDLVSFDVFDTLLLRMCAEPTDIFLNAGKRLSSTFPEWGLSPEAYKTARIDAEKRSRRKKWPNEHTFDDILAELDVAGQYRPAMKRFEIECEKDVVFLNKSVYSLLEHCAALGKHVILISNMYHSGETITQLLAGAGFDVSLLSGCFVSSDYGCLKGDGRLFEQALSRFPSIDRERAVHIGDNMSADVNGAKIAGVHSLYYGAMSNVDNDFHDLEKQSYGVMLGGLQSLRKLSAAMAPEKDVECFFHGFGAEVIGPVYSVFADWILELAEKHDVKRILPFMREGALLAEVIKAADGNHRFVCEPIFVSRRTAFVASIFEDNYEERIGQAMLRGNRNVKDSLEELGLDVAATKFARTSSLTVHDQPIDAITAFLGEEENKSAVLAYATGQRILLREYLSGIANGQPALTVDIGTKGTTEAYLHELQGRDPSFPSLKHAVMLGAPTLSLKMEQGLEITAWAGIRDDCAEIIHKLQYQIQVLETLVNAACGAVLRYERSGEKAIPLFSKEISSKRQKRKIKSVWKGILDFQSNYLDLKSQKPAAFRRLSDKKSDLLGILLRWIEMPSGPEAREIGGLAYLDDWNFSRERTLCGAQYSGELDEASVGKFISSQLKAGFYWPQAGIPVKRKLLIGKDPASLFMDAVIRDIAAKGLKCGVIFAAGDVGMKCQRLADESRLPVVCFVDNNKKLQGTVVTH